MRSPSVLGPTSSYLIIATLSLNAVLVNFNSSLSLFTSVSCFTLSYGFLNYTYLLKN
jgi:hypothetical protein